MIPINRDRFKHWMNIYPIVNSHYYVILRFAAIEYAQIKTIEINNVDL